MGCRKERESIRGLWFLPPFPHWAPASSQSSETQLRPWGRSAVHLCSHLPKSHHAPSSVWLPKIVSPQGCWSHDIHRAGPPHNLPPPPLAARRPNFPHPTQQKNQWSISTHSFWVNGWPQTIFYRRQLTDLSLAPLKDPEFVFEACEIVHLPKVPY